MVNREGADQMVGECGKGSKRVVNKTENNRNGILLLKEQWYSEDCRAK